MLPGAVPYLFRHGWIGVQMFWVIAGFVLVYSLRNARFTPVEMGRFAARRVLRLGMPYWTAILLVAALTVAALLFTNWPPPDDKLSWGRLAANLAFLQDILALENITAGTWFVCVDLQLGLAVAAMLWLGRLLTRGSPPGGKADVLTLIVLFVPVGLAALFWWNHDVRFDAWIIYYFHLPLLGMLAWWALQERVPRTIFWAYVAVLAAAAAIRWHLGLDNKFLEVVIALITGLTIYAAGRRGHLHDWLSARWLQFLGRISYSLFLIHYPVSWIVLSAGSRLTGNSAAAAVTWLAVALAASIGAAYLLYDWVEQPSLRLCAMLKTEVKQQVPSPAGRGPG